VPDWASFIGAVKHSLDIFSDVSGRRYFEKFEDSRNCYDILAVTEIVGRPYDPTLLLKGGEWVLDLLDKLIYQLVAVSHYVILLFSPCWWHTCLYMISGVVSM